MGIITYTCLHCFIFTCSYWLWMTSSPIKHPASSYIWYLLVNEYSPEITTAGPLMNIHNMCLGNTHTHTHTHTPGRKSTTSASVWVNPYVCEASGPYGTRMRESLLIGNRHADRQAVLLHNGRSKKKKKKKAWLSSSASSPSQRTDGGRRKRASGSGSLPCHSSADASFIYWKINQTRARPAQAPSLISCSLTGRCFQSHLQGHS